MFIIWTIILFIALFLSGIIILRRSTSENRAQIIIPAGGLFGIALYIFLINTASHIIKELPAFYLSLGIQINWALWCHYKLPVSKIDFPKGKVKLFWISTIFIWGIFLYQITAHSIIDGGDSIIYYSLASRFIRGDYPIHFPSQPSYIAYNHIGGPQFLGAVKAITGAPFNFIHSFLAFISLFSISQILTWLIYKKEINFKKTLLISVTSVVGIITLGSFMLAWPITLQFPNLDMGILNWLKHLPTLNLSFESYGSPTELDALVLFLHRFLATCLLVASLIPILSPRFNKMMIFVMLIFLSSISLVDESVFIVVLPGVLFILLLYSFNKSVKHWIVFILLTILIVSFQGGIITETILNRYHENSSILFFPKDGSTLSEKYNSYRLYQQDSRFFSGGQYSPLVWFHPAIYLQLIILFLLALVYIRNKDQQLQKLKILTWLLLIFATTAFIAFHGLVPKGYTHPNGNRFLALAYYFSGLGLSYLIIQFFSEKPFPKLINILLKSIVIWSLLISVIPPLVVLFPRKKENWFLVGTQPTYPIFEWIQKNIELNKGIILLTDPDPRPVSNMLLAEGYGVLTPLWPSIPRVHDSFDMSPTYADLYFTLNPQSIKDLGMDYIAVNTHYISSLPKIRLADLTNTDFFKPLYSSQIDDIVIYEIQKKYLTNGENLEGTFEQLEKIAPKTGTYYIDYPPNITENIFRALRLLLNNREIYYNPAGAFYNQRIDINLKDVRSYTQEIIDENYLKNKKYDFLLLGTNVIPESICTCQAKLLWSGLGNDIKLWVTH